MSNFAKVPSIVDGKGVVETVIVVEQEFIDTGALGLPTIWVQTSYNTRGGVHYGANNEPDGGVALRGNYAGIGDTYDKDLNVFYRKQPFASWTLDNTFTWQPPTPMPRDTSSYYWDEALLSWVGQTPAEKPATV